MFCEVIANIEYVAIASVENTIEVSNVFWFLNAIVHFYMEKILTLFLMYHFAFLPLWDNLHEKVTSSMDPCLMVLSTGSSIHSNFS